MDPQPLADTTPEIRRHPDASEHEVQLRLAQVILGAELARAARPGIDTLDRP